MTESVIEVKAPAAEKWELLRERLPEIDTILCMVAYLVRNADEHKHKIAAGSMYVIRGNEVKMVSTSMGKKPEYVLEQVDFALIADVVATDAEAARITSGYDVSREILLVVPALTDAIPIILCKIPYGDAKFTIYVPSHGVSLDLRKSVLDVVQDTWLRRSNVCSNPGCSQQVNRQQVGSQLVGKGMKRCSQCKQVAYCSRECQVVHWKAGHRKACAKYAQK